MSRIAKSIGFALIVFLRTTHRVPEPIVEEQKSTPAPEQSEAPKRTHSTRSTTTDKSSAQIETRAQAAPAPGSQGPARFAGTWSGKVNQGLLGHVPTTLSIQP